MNNHNLKNARKKSNMTQAEVAKAIGVGQSTYKNYECGLREPNGDTIVMLADLFNVTTDYLLGRETGEPKPIEQLATEFNMSPIDKRLVEGYLELPNSTRDKLTEFLAKTVQETE